MGHLACVGRKCSQPPLTARSRLNLSPLNENVENKTNIQSIIDLKEYSSA